MPTSLADHSPSLPPHLQITEALPPEQVPLQVALLTMEIADLRMRLAALARLLIAAAGTVQPPDGETALIGMGPNE